MSYILTKNDEISLIMPDWHYGKDDFFEVVLNESNKVVGNIRFHHELSSTTGNIEYNIFEEFSGNNYAKKALKLFANNVFKISDEDLFISILPNNKASIKTAIGAGALFYKVVDIPKNYKISGKYKYAYMYIIKNDRGVNIEKNKNK